MPAPPPQLVVPRPTADRPRHRCVANNSSPSVTTAPGTSQPVPAPPTQHHHAAATGAAGGWLHEAAASQAPQSQSCNGHTRLHVRCTRTCTRVQCLLACVVRMLQYFVWGGGVGRACVFSQQQQQPQEPLLAPCKHQQNCIKIPSNGTSNCNGGARQCMSLPCCTIFDHHRQYWYYY